MPYWFGHWEELFVWNIVHLVMPVLKQREIKGFRVFDFCLCQMLEFLQSSFPFSSSLSLFHLRNLVEILHAWTWWRWEYAKVLTLSTSADSVSRVRGFLLSDFNCRIRVLHLYLGIFPKSACTGRFVTNTCNGLIDLLTLDSFW